MVNLSLALFVVLLVFYGLFLYRPSALKSLSSSRWIILSWSILISFNLLLPITSNTLIITNQTIIYIFLWILFFILSNYLGFHSVDIKNLNTKTSEDYFLIKHKWIINFGIYLSLFSGIIYGYNKYINLTEFSTFSLSELRNQLINSVENFFDVSLAVFALTGLAFSLLKISRHILSGKRIPIDSYFGILGYILIYVFRAGRQGLLISFIALILLIFSCVQLKEIKLFKAKKAFLPSILLFTLFVVYFIYNVSTRSIENGDMLNKIRYIESTLSMTVEQGYIDSLLSLGVFGNVLMEISLYFIPQLYGLDLDLRLPSNEYTLGAFQFAYIMRRLSFIYDNSLLLNIIQGWDNRFLHLGIQPNFFRTAISTTTIDFGMFGGLFFTSICGYLTGRCHNIAVTLKSPFFVSLQSLICSGCFFSIIYSPFCEIGWAYPWLIFTAIIVFSIPFYRKSSYESI